MQFTDFMYKRLKRKTWKDEWSLVELKRRRPEKYVQEIGCEGVDCILLSKRIIQWLAHVKTVKEYRVPWKVVRDCKFPIKDLSKFN